MFLRREPNETDVIARERTRARALSPNRCSGSSDDNGTETSGNPRARAGPAARAPERRELISAKRVGALPRSKRVFRRTTEMVWPRSQFTILNGWETSRAAGFL
ncbi:hypothetical protein AAFF_G00171260 [Aldrovandia affinis]|uniref:Uncharacterized protein n=1 Tax=Aldrovandia affinis TaxID=143900 RepID=A0AAD7RP55_9TELE|nr:hypothetical protein AAFF_G00171260 [Aldrovandia affinis]